MVLSAPLIQVDFRVRREIEAISSVVDVRLGTVNARRRVATATAYAIAEVIVEPATVT